MSKITLTGFGLVLVVCFLGIPPGITQPNPNRKIPTRRPAQLQRMIVQSGSVTMQLDLNRMNGISSVAGKPTTLHLVAAANYLFSVINY